MTGTREWPAAAIASRACATVRSLDSDSTEPRGTRTWRTSRSCRSSAPLMIPRCSSSSPGLLVTRSRSSSAEISSAVASDLPAEQAHDEVGRGAEHRHGRTRERGKHVEGAGHRQRPRQGQLHRQSLGRQLADYQGDERQDEGHRRDDHRFGHGPEEGDVGDEGFGQGDRGGRRGEETGQRDADLDGREEAVGVARQAHQALAPDTAGPLQLTQLALPQGDQGHLTSREDGVEQHQGPDEGDVEPVARHGWGDHRSLGGG